MTSLNILTIAFASLIIVFLIIYLAINRIKVKKSEDFEKRDN